MEKYICKQCGREVDKGAAACPWCGASLVTTMGHPQMTKTDYKSEDMQNKAMAYYLTDNGAFIWILVGLFLPPIGIILYFMKRKSRPHARYALFSAIASLIILLIILLVTRVIGKKKLRYPDWVDYGKYMGQEKAVVLEELEKNGQWWNEKGGGYMLGRKEFAEEGRSFTVTLWFDQEDKMIGVSKDFFGRIDNEKEFVVKFYKEMVRFYGTPDQPPAAFRYDTWDQFYDGMVVMDVEGKEERSLTAIWEDRHLVIDIRTNNGQILIKYTQVNEESWPDRF